MSEPIGDPNCPSCGGAGWVRVADGGAGSARPCTCTAKSGLIRKVKALGIPPKFQQAKFESFLTKVGSNSNQNESLLSALATCRNYVAEFSRIEGRNTSTGLLLMGQPGVGKTHLAVATLRSIVGSGLTTGRFLNLTSFISDLQSTFDPTSQESKHDLLDPVLETGLLVVDDLGARQPTHFLNEVLYLIVNTRYVNQRPTIFTTNLYVEKLSEKSSRPEREAFVRPLSFDQNEAAEQRVTLLTHRLPKLLVSRLVEMTKQVVIDAPDYREQKGKFLEQPA